MKKLSINLEKNLRQLANASFYTYEEIEPIYKICKEKYFMPKTKCLEVLSLAHEYNCDPMYVMSTVMHVDFVVKPAIERKINEDK